MCGVQSESRSDEGMDQYKFRRLSTMVPVSQHTTSASMFDQRSLSANVDVCFGRTHPEGFVFFLKSALVASKRWCSTTDILASWYLDRLNVCRMVVEDRVGRHTYVPGISHLDRRLLCIHGALDCSVCGQSLSKFGAAKVAGGQTQLRPKRSG